MRAVSILSYYFIMKKWIRLNSDFASDFSKSLVKIMRNIGISDPVLHGGSLRDMYLRRHDRIVDYDVHGSIAGLIDDQQDNVSSIAEKILSMIKDGIPGVHGFENLTMNRCNRTDAVSIGFDFVLGGKSISLGTDSRNDSFSTIALYADAPLNAIGMNADAVVIAHPLFEVHASDRVFSPFKGTDNETLERRFAKMSAKFPTLTKAPSIERSVPPPEPFYCKLPELKN